MGTAEPRRHAEGVNRRTGKAWYAQWSKQWTRQTFDIREVEGAENIITNRVVTEIHVGVDVAPHIKWIGDIIRSYITYHCLDQHYAILRVPFTDREDVWHNQKFNTQIPWGSLSNIYCVYWTASAIALGQMDIWDGILHMKWFTQLLMHGGRGECYFMTSTLHHLPHMLWHQLFHHYITSFTQVMTSDNRTLLLWPLVEPYSNYTTLDK